MDIHRCSFLDYTPEPITCSAFSHDSDLEQITPKNFRLAVGRGDGTIEIWNPYNSRSKWVLENTIPGSKGNSIEGLVWSSSNDPNAEPRLFSIGGSTILTEWDLSTGMPLKNFDCNAGIIWSISVNSTHDKIALGCDDGSVVVVNINGGPGVIEHEMILQRQKYRVLSLCWTNNNLLLGGCADGRIRCWAYNNNGVTDENDESANLNNDEANDGNLHGRIIQTLRIDKDKSEPSLIWSLLYLPKSNQFVSGDSTGSIKIWDLKHLVLQQTFQIHEADVLCLSRDESGERFFTSGVDRKIFTFNYTKISKNNYKWVNMSNRLLHGNDVRTMSCYQSKNLDFLVSGGIERILHINSAKNFQSSVSFKLPINPSPENVLIHSEKRLILMYQKNTIKIWRFKSDNTKKLVSKLTLSDPENITNIDISSNGKYLLVSRLSVIKLYRLNEVDNGDKFTVSRINSDLLSTMGAKQSKFLNEQNMILVYTSDNEILTLKFNSLAEDDEFDDYQDPVEYDIPEESNSKSKSNFGYLSNYAFIKVNTKNSVVALCKLNGLIDILDVSTGEFYNLIKLSSIATCINFSSNSTLLAVTLDHKVHEFNIFNKNKSNGQIYSKWSMTNSNSMPPKFLSLPGCAFGIFESLNRCYVYGADWFCFFDFNYDLPAVSPKENNKKRSRNGNEVVSDVEALKSNNEENNKCFWLTKNYSDLLFAGSLNESEIVIVERHLEDMSNPPAFKLNKYSV